MNGFEVIEATVESLHEAFASGTITAVDLVEVYHARIEALDRRGPQINSIISLNERVIDEAEKLDQQFMRSGPVGPLHGVPVLLKDQIDADGMPTTLGSVLLREFWPGRDSAVVRQLRSAGAIILGKATLGELGGGDTHGTLFGSTRNPYDLDRTPGGSSGGTGAAVSANLSMVGVGQEGFASIRRPAAWNSIVGMRPSAGMIPRTGVFAGWPGIVGAVGPMTRTVIDLARMMDVMVSYDPSDPLTAMGAVTARSGGFLAQLDEHGLRGARIGVLRTSMGNGSVSNADDFKAIEEVFDRSVGELAAAGADLVDPIVIPDLVEHLSARVDADRGGGEEAFAEYLGSVQGCPFETLAALFATPGYFPRGSIQRVKPSPPIEHLEARETLMFNFMKVMADHELDAIVHRTVEHQPTPIAEHGTPAYTNMKGATHLNTLLVYVPSISVPAGFQDNGLPVGISFLGRPYSDRRMIQLAYGYEQATHHRRPPSTPLEL